MARTALHEIPSYRLHKPKGLAVVRLNGRDILLGKYGTAESKTAYERIITEWLANGRQLPASRPVETVTHCAFTVNDLMVVVAQASSTKTSRRGSSPTCVARHETRRSATSS